MLVIDIITHSHTYTHTTHILLFGQGTNSLFSDESPCDCHMRVPVVGGQTLAVLSDDLLATSHAVQRIRPIYTEAGLQELMR